MKYSALGGSGLQVSRVCLGTMTWGTQNNQKDADEQLAYALDSGINFIDTAEMYSIPPKPDSYGNSETIIGDWLSRNSQRRDDFVLATKIVGSGLPWIRDGGPITGETISIAIDESLQRLQTDVIDLYQLHWPNRGSAPHFGKHWPNKVRFDRFDRGKELDGMRDMLHALAENVRAGKIKCVGLSDESVWGIAQFQKLARECNLPMVVSIQNEFNLLNAKDYPYLLEYCYLENIAYLPWSPLATGALTGKYLNGKIPEGSRWSLGARQGLFRNTEQASKAVQAYVDLAKDYGITPAQLALKWIDSVEGVTSTIIGATNMQQLKENIDAFETQLDFDQFKQVTKLLIEHGMPF